MGNVGAIRPAPLSKRDLVEPTRACRRRVGFVVCVLTFLCIGFQLIEARLGLLVGAMAMFLVARRPSLWFRIFVDTMGRTEFLKVILPVFAFASVANATGCTDAFVRLFANRLVGFGPVLVPLTVIVAFLTNTALVSATASGLAVGVVFLPILDAAGVSPALAAASVLAGMWGAVLTPGSKHAAIIAKAARDAEVGRTRSDVQAMDIVRGHSRLVFVMLLIVAAIMWLESTTLFSHPRAATEAVVQETPRHTDYGAALVLVVPLILLWVLNLVRQKLSWRWFAKDLLVIEAMLIGTVLAVASAGWHSDLFKGKPGKPFGTALSEAFFSDHGMAAAYGSVMSVIIAAMVFVAGLERLGVLEMILKLLKNQRQGAAWFGLFGCLGFAGLSGSGDAAACSFNLGVTPHARQLNARIRELGSMAWLGGEMGRCLSPVAAVTLALEESAHVDNPLQIVSWTIVPMFVAGVIGVLLRHTIRE